MIIRDVRVPDFDLGVWRHVDVRLASGRIAGLSETPLPGNEGVCGNGGYLVPGFIDAHCHVESMLLPPAAFGRIVAADGTLHTVADCHEIANVDGHAGVRWFMADGVSSPCHIHLAVPSCVPATPFNGSGGALSISDVQSLLDRPETVSLGELMNVPGILDRSEPYMSMIRAARDRNKRINGHAPGLSGNRLRRYMDAGITDDHEAERVDEIRERLAMGVTVFLRQGSAEHTEPEAYALIPSHPEQILFCTDDRSIYDTTRDGHLTVHLRHAVENGVPLLSAVQCATRNAARYYRLAGAGQVLPGYAADLVLLSHHGEVRVEQVFRDGMPLGRWVSPAGSKKMTAPGRFQLPDPLIVPQIPTGTRHLAIGVSDGSLITEPVQVDPAIPEISPAHDLLKLVVINRYGSENAAACRIKGFGFQKGAMATSLAHDCHNVVAVGSCDRVIRSVIDQVGASRGGMAVTDGERTVRLPLPVGGILFDGEPAELLTIQEDLRVLARGMGCPLHDPLGTLSFMTLEVIPRLKLTDRGLFDVERFRYVDPPTSG